MQKSKTHEIPGDVINVTALNKLHLALGYPGGGAGVVLFLHPDDYQQFFDDMPPSWRFCRTNLVGEHILHLSYVVTPDPSVRRGWVRAVEGIN